jgi:hypothetical protein
MPCTRVRTSSLTARVLLITCETVEIDTPARSATCFIVAIAFLLSRDYHRYISKVTTYMRARQCGASA